MKAPQHPKNSRTWIVTTVIYGGILLIIYILAYAGKLPPQLSQIPHHDTILHFVLYGIAAYLGHQAFKKRKIKLLGYYFPFWPLLYSIFTIAEELFQMFSPNRTFSILDLVASLLGILVGYRFAESRKNDLETRNK